MEACSAIKQGLLRAGGKLEIRLFPLADGGDGFSDVMKYYSNTVSEQLQSVDPVGRIIFSSYEYNLHEHTAIIELASCSGLAMLEKNLRNPLLTSTYGTGLQILHAIRKGAKKIILGIGGSATNDAGTGILGALGFQFQDSNGNILNPCGEALSVITQIIPPMYLPTVEIEIACDVNNPLYGPEGAALIFSPQKGATSDQVELLDSGLKNFASIIEKQTGKDVSNFPGSGAAGGIAAGLMAYLPVKIIEGTELIFRASNIKNSLDGADIIITGEGKIDLQSFRGKTVSAVTAMASQKQIPVVALCGKLELSEPEWKELGIALAAALNDGSSSEEESMQRAHEMLADKAEWIFPYLKKLDWKK